LSEFDDPLDPVVDAGDKTYKVGASTQKHCRIYDTKMLFALWAAYGAIQ
jgi:hypothetical protein